LKEGKGAVSSFTDAKGITYLPGEIVDLPESYKGENWLEPIDAEAKVEVPPAKVESAESTAPAVPLEEKKSDKKTK
jgi:hypothetical protein